MRQDRFYPTIVLAGHQCNDDNKSGPAVLCAVAAHDKDDTLDPPALPPALRPRMGEGEILSCFASEEKLLFAAINWNFVLSTFLYTPAECVLQFINQQGDKL